MTKDEEIAELVLMMGRYRRHDLVSDRDLAIWCWHALKGTPSRSRDEYDTSYDLPPISRHVP